MWTPTDDQKLAQEGLARILSERWAPKMRAAASNREFPEAELRAALAALAPHGLGNFRIPEAFGGQGLDLVTTGLLHEIASRHTPELSSPALINDGVGLLLSRCENAALQRAYLPSLAAGQLIAASANTELSGGSDVRAIKTRARRKGASYVINGRKVWITNGQFADFVIVLARTEETGALDLYLVDRARHGFEARPLVVAGRVTTAELSFADIEVPLENKLTDRGGLAAMLSSFQATRGLVALSAIGMAQAALDYALSFAKEREQFGRPIAATQLVQAQLADCATELEAARLLAYRALAMADRGENVELAGSMAKLFATEAAQRIVYRCVQIHGAAGLCDEMPISRLTEAIRVFPVVEGTSEIQRLVIGRRLTGVSAF